MQKSTVAARPLYARLFRRAAALLLVLLVLLPSPLGAQGTTFTFSRSNLLDGGLDLAPGLTSYDVIRALEEALGLWASVAPLNFNEVPDAGPAVSDLEYFAAGLPDIRVGHHDFSGNTLAHAYFPGNSGLASDLHLDDTDRVWTESLLMTTLVHELGHALGVDHIDDQLSVMNSTLGGENILPGIDSSYLFAPETAAIRTLWGTGTGQVTSTRRWMGGESSRWMDDDNWREGGRPTPHSDVYLDHDGSSSLDAGVQTIRSLTMAGGTNELQIRGSSRLELSQGATLGRAQGGTALVQTGTTAKVHVPTSGLDQSGWTQLDFDDSAWQSGPTSIGFERSDGYASLIKTDLEAQMYNRTGSFYSRLEFDVDAPDQWDFLQLDMQYDDGFVAYLNGTQVAAGNAPGTTAWNSTAPRSRADEQALQFEAFDLSPWLSLLEPGRNVLAIQGMNNRINSSDLLMTPELHGGPLANHLVVDQGELRVGGDLLLAEAAGSEAWVELLDGSIIVHGDVTRGAGSSRLAIRGGEFQVEGALSVDQLDFYGGQLPGVTRVEGSFQHHEGELSPQALGPADHVPTRLQIDGQYAMGPDATLRLDRSGDGIDSLQVSGLAQLSGTLAIVDRLPPSADEDLASGQTDSRPLLLAEQVDSEFLAVTVNGAAWMAGHQSQGLFQQLLYEADRVSLVSYRALPGDANGDQRFDSSDLLQVFQIGQYEDAIENNSDWPSGDWTGDGEFATEDLVVALQWGRYESTAEMARAVPEPTSQLLGSALSLVIGVCASRRSWAKFPAV